MATHRRPLFITIHDGYLTMPYVGAFSDPPREPFIIARDVLPQLRQSAASNAAAQSCGGYEEDGLSWGHVADPLKEKALTRCILSARAINSCQRLCLRTSFHSKVVIEGQCYTGALLHDFLSSSLHRPGDSASRSIERWVCMDLNLTTNEWITDVHGAKHPIHVHSLATFSREFCAIHIPSKGILAPMYPLFPTSVDCFRPEFLRDWTTPLCPNALDGGIIHKETHVANLAHATLFLLNVAIPQAATHLNTLSRPLGHPVATVCHCFGINLKFLGWMIPWLEPAARLAVQTEIAVRSCCRLVKGKVLADPALSAQAAFESITEDDITAEAHRYYFPPHRRNRSREVTHAAIPVLRHVLAVYDIEESMLSVVASPEIDFELRLPEVIPHTTLPPVVVADFSWSSEKIRFHAIDMRVFREQVARKLGMGGSPPYVKCSHARVSELSRVARIELSNVIAQEYLERLRWVAAHFRKEDPTLLRAIALAAVKLQPFEHNAEAFQCLNSALQFSKGEEVCDARADLARFLAHEDRAKVREALAYVEQGKRATLDPIRRVGFERLQVLWSRQEHLLPCHVLTELYQHIVVALHHTFKTISSEQGDAHPMILAANVEAQELGLVASLPSSQSTTNEGQQLVVHHRGGVKTLLKSYFYLLKSTDSFLATGLRADLLATLRSQMDNFKEGLDLYVAPPCVPYPMALLDPSLYKSELPPSNLHSAVEDFLTSDRKVFVAVLEHGKTQFLARLMLRLWAMDGCRALTQVPIYLQCARATSAGSVLKENLSPMLSPEDLHVLARSKSVVVCVDSLGDVPMTEGGGGGRHGGSGSVLGGTCNGTNLLLWDGKIVVTVRKSFTRQFPTKDLLNLIVPAKDRSTMQGAIQIVKVCKFDDSCIKNYMRQFVARETHKQAHGPNSPWCRTSSYAHMIWHAVPSSLRIARKPILLALLMRVLPDIPKRLGFSTLADVYDVLWTSWMSLNNENISTTDLHFYCTSLASVMFIDKVHDVHVKDPRTGSTPFSVPQWAEAFFGEEQANMVAAAPLDFKLGNASYSFVHRSVGAYFLSLRIYLEITTIRRPERVTNATEAIFQLLADWSLRHKQTTWKHDAQTQVTNVLKNFLYGPRNHAATMVTKATNKFKRLLVDKGNPVSHFTGGEFLCKYNIAPDSDVVGFLSDRVKTDNVFQQALWAIVTSRKEDASVARANVFAIFSRAGISLAGTEMTFVKAPGADLRKLCFTAADLRFSCFRRSNFVGALLDHALTLNMDATGADFGSSNDSALHSTGAFLCVCQAHDGSDLVALGDEFGNATVWTSAMDTPVQTFHHTTAVVCVRFTPDSAALATATASSDSVAYLWCMKSGRMLMTFTGHVARITSLEVCNRNLLVTAAHDSSVLVWNLKPEEQQPSDFARSLPTGPKQRPIQGKIRASRLPSPSAAPPGAAVAGDRIHSLKGITNMCLSLAYNPLRELLAAGSADGMVRIWSMKNFREVCDIDMDRKSVECMAFTPDGTLIAIPQIGCCGLWDTASGKRERLFTPNTSLTEHITSVAFSTDGRNFAAAFDTTIYLFDVFNTKILQIFVGHTRRISGLDFSPLGDRVYTTAWDGTVRVWSTKGGKAKDLAETENPQFLVGNDAYLTAVSASGTISLCHTNTGEKFSTLVTSKSEINVVTVQKERMLLGVGRDFIITVYDVLGANLPIVLQAHTRMVTGLSFISVNQADSLVSCSLDRSLRLWNLTLRCCVNVIMCEGPIWSLGTHTTVACVYATNRTTGVQIFQVNDIRATSRSSVAMLSILRPLLRVFMERTDILSAADVKAVLLPFFLRTQQLSPNNPVTLPIVCTSYKSAFHNTGLLAVAMDKVVSCWVQPSDPATRYVLEGHSATITEVGFATGLSCLTVVTGSYDGTIRLWQQTACVLLIHPPEAAPITCMTITGPYITACHANHVMRQWTLPGAACIIGNLEPFCSMSQEDLRQWFRKSSGSTCFDACVEGMLPDQALRLTAVNLKKYCPDDPAMVMKVTDDLRKVIEGRYEHATYLPCDDITLTSDQFSSYDKEKVSVWLPHEGSSASLPNPLCFMIQTEERLNGQDLLALDLKGLEERFKVNFGGESGLVCLLHQEMSYVRAKFRDGFSLKTVEEVLTWAKGKPHEIALSAALLQASGAALLDLTAFDLVYSDVCKECKQPSSSADICPVTKKPHMTIGSGSELHSRNTQQNIARIAYTMHQHYSQCLTKLHSSLRAIPTAKFRHGMYWYKILRQPGYMALLKFRLSRMRMHEALVVLRSVLTMRLGNDSVYRIVVAPDSSEQLFHAFTGCKVTTAPASHKYHTEDSLLPVGWKKTLHRAAHGVMEGVYYSPTQIPHAQHPTMPVSHRAITDHSDHQASSLVTVAMTYQPGDTIKNPLPQTAAPQPQHFLQPPHSEDKFYMEADVSSQVQTQLKYGKDAMIPEVTFVIVSEDLAECEEYYPTERPQLNVTYHYKDTLCRCTSSYSKGELCDRLCNVNTECKGHVCISRDKYCRRAPHLRWQKCTKS